MPRLLIAPVTNVHLDLVLLTAPVVERKPRGLPRVLQHEEASLPLRVDGLLDNC